MKKLLSLFIFLLSLNAFALHLDSNKNYVLEKGVFDVASLIKDYAKIQGINVIIDDEVRGKLRLYGTKTILKQDMELFISAVADQTGYTLLKTENLNQIEVINSRDIRYRGSKIYTDIKDVPENYNQVQYVTRLKYIEASEVSRNMRPFMSRYGRVIDEKNANTLIIADTGKNINRLAQLISKIDTKEYLESQKFIDELNSKSKKEITKKENLLTFISDQHILFIIAFSFIGMILGFGIRGYSIKKIEGGW